MLIAEEKSRQKAVNGESQVELVRVITVAYFMMKNGIGGSPAREMKRKAESSWVFSLLNAIELDAFVVVMDAEEKVRHRLSITIE